MTWFFHGLSILTPDLVDSVIFSNTAHEVWEDLQSRFSQSNAPRIFEIERDIACLTQDQMSVAAYYTKLKKLWDELASYNDAVCTCGIGNKRRRLMQFLMSLNESYSAIRGQILLMNPLPDVGQAYSSITQEEKQRNLGIAMVTAQNSAMHIQQPKSTIFATQSRQGSHSCSNSSNRKVLHCDYCDRDHHTMKTCWKLHGFPPGHPKHQSNQKHGTDGSDVFGKIKGKHPSWAHNVKDGSSVPDVQTVMNGLSDLQLQQILSIVHNKSAPTVGAQPLPSNPNVNVTGTSSGLSKKPLIVDSGASDHLTSTPASLIDSKKNFILPPVIMPNGDKAPIVSTSTLPLNSSFSLKNVLGVPTCKVDLISVSRLTRDLNCFLTFSPH